MNRLTKVYKNGMVTLDATPYGVAQAVLDCEIRNCKPVREAVKRLAEYEEAEGKDLKEANA